MTLCGLTIADVSFAKQVIKGVEVPGAIRSLGKGAKPLVTPMAPPLHDALYDYVLASSDLKGQSPLVAQKNGKPLNRRLVEKMAHRWGAPAKIPGCTPHRFRHNAGCRIMPGSWPDAGSGAGSRHWVSA